MTLWNKVLSGFDAEDETVNFGARTVAESYDSVYETRTLATIQADGEVVNDPTIVASIHDSALCVTIDKSITIFADQSCQEIRLCSGFDSLITSHYISKDYYFVFVALTNGTLYCLNLKTGGRLVFFRNVLPSYEVSGEVIIKIFSQDAAGHNESDLLLVTSKAHIYKISGFNEKVMEAVLDVEDMGKLEELTQDIQCCSLFREQRVQQVTIAEVNLVQQKQSVVMVGKDIYIWPSQQLCSLKFLPYEYTKVQYFKNNRFLLCLRTDGALNIVCSTTLLATKVWDGPVSDMVIVEDEAEAPPQILVLLRPKEGSFTTFIQLVSFPDFQVKFNLQVPTTTYLVNLDGGCIDEIVFLEGAGQTSTAIDTVKVKAIEENLPEYRLQRLLRRGKYEEAEIFAKRFNLSTDAIYCAKAAALTKQFNSSANDSDVPNRLNELFDTLDKIKDVELVFQYCHNTVTSDFEQTRQLVCYARERLIKDVEKTNDNLIATHLFDLNSTLLRIETYEMIHRIREISDTPNNEDINSWAVFSQSDLLTECKNYLIHGELKVAALIWVRHSSTLLARVTTDMVRDMLQIIPNGLLQDKLWPWLFHFVPSLLSVFPDGLSEIVIWGYKRAKSFEQFDRSNWPESGLHFCKSLMRLLNFEESQSFFTLQQQYSTKHSPLQHLTAVIQALTDLQYLKKNYRLVVKIEAYMGEPIEVAHLLLHKVYPQKVSSFVTDFLHQYMLNHSLKNDHVLVLYIQKTLKRSEGWWFWEEAPWEQKVASIIGCIHNVESRLQQTLDTLKKASVPWSPTMLALVETSTSVNHSLVSAIITERNSVATKLILKKYGYQHIGINDTLIKYIMKQNRDGMLNDLYELTRSNHSLKTRALSICVNFFLNKGDLEHTMTVIKNQPDEDALYCCKQVINYISVCLRFEEMNNTAEYYAELLGIVQVKLRSILLSSSNTHDISAFDDTLATVSELKSLCLLRKEFGFNLTLTEYQTQSEIILKKQLKHLCNELEDKKLSTLSIYKKGVRIADLLELPRILAVCFLLENTRNTEILNYYIEGIKGVGSFPPKECPYVKRLCQICIFDLKLGEARVLSSLKDVSASAIDSCSIGQLSQILVTTVWTRLSSKIIANESMSETDMRNGITKWRLDKIYTDPAMCSDQMVLPFFIKSFKFYSFCTDSEEFKSESTLAQENCSKQLTDLIARMKAISTESYDFPLLQILNTLVSSCSFTTTMSDQIIPPIQSVREKCLHTLLQKIISARTFDLQSGLSCLSMLSEQDAIKWLTSACKVYHTDYFRLHALSDLGYEYCCSIGNKSHLKYFAYYQKCHYWARRLSDYGIHHKEIIISNTEGKQQILERLMRSEKSGLIDLLKEFCTDFEFDLDECYIIYLDILLKQWNPTAKIITLNSKKELEINKDEITVLNKTCKQVAALIEDKSSMRKHLATLWKKVNFYHYEVFLLIMELLEDTNETRLNHFHFLQNYVRFGPPTQIEYEEWSQLCPENNSLPGISKWRLPFLPKVDQWKLIEPELNLSTYQQWMEVAQILNLQIHLICTFAIKGSVNQVWGSSGELTKRNSNEWLIHPKNSALLEDIKSCIKHMPDKDALYYGTAVLYYVVNHTLPGADQAAAAQECYAYAQKWSQASVQSDKVMIEKTKFKYLQLTTKHILYTHGLGNEHYLQLATSPERLVQELYMDESIVLRSRGATEHRPDINSAVNELGTIFSLNLIQLRLELLEEWLQPSVSNSKLDDSITYNVAAVTSGTEDNAIDDDNLLRACYILEWGDKIMSANYLINIGFGVKNEASFRPGIQFRALHVLLSITDSATVQDLTKRDLQSIKQYMKSLRYVSELERLGLTFSVHRFESSSKLELAQALSRMNARSPEALILILQMCIDFELKCYTLWDETLSGMARMSMVRELGKFLPKVSTASHAVGCNGYIKGWEVLIWEPFRRTDALLSQKQFDECLTSICLLHSCPVAKKLNIKPIIKICFQSHHPELAAALLPFLTKNDSDFVIKTISSSYEIQKVIQDLRALSTRQILTISYSVRILEESSQSNLAKNYQENMPCKDSQLEIGI